MDVVIGGYVEYNVSEGQDEKSGCRVLFTGWGIGDLGWLLCTSLDLLKQHFKYGT